MFNEGAQNSQWRKDSLFNKCCWDKWISTCRWLKLDPCLSPCININSKWIKDLKTWNIETTIKKNREKCGTYKYRQYFLHKIPIAQQSKKRINKWECFKLKSFCSAKEIVIRLNRQPIKWVKIFASYMSNMGLITRTYRDLKMLNFKWINNPIKKWAIFKEKRTNDK
jgi:hypothetical protein